VEKRLHECKLHWNDKKAVSVILTSKGYPGVYQTGYGIDIPETKSMVFHAGTAVGDDGKIVTSGGRVLAVTALGANFEEARRAVYEDVERIEFEGKAYRTDIGLLEK
jgi:phosphoribosylamine--glycine ligase